MLIRAAKHAKHVSHRWYCTHFRCNSLRRPVFLTGCGRSGTTILGKAISQHEAVTYLREPRDIWESWYPATDVWSPLAGKRGGKLYFDRSDAVPGPSRRLRGDFCFRTDLTGRPQLVSKLPENNFRLEFIRAVFPDALILHIIRNGAEVADSIKSIAPKWAWYGANDHKWKALAAYARTRDAWKDLPELCATDFERGLLEWRLSVETAVEQLDAFPQSACLQVRYEDLLVRPVEVLEQIERFIGLEPSDSVNRFAREKISRRSPAISPESLNAVQRRIAGDLLVRLGYENTGWRKPPEKESAGLPC